MENQLRHPQPDRQEPARRAWLQEPPVCAARHELSLTDRQEPALLAQCGLEVCLGPRAETGLFSLPHSSDYI